MRTMSSRLKVVTKYVIKTKFINPLPTITHFNAYITNLGIHLELCSQIFKANHDNVIRLSRFA